MNKLFGAIAATAMLLSLTTSSAYAVQIADPVGDFLPTFAGDKGADLDVVLADGTINPNKVFTFTAKMNGKIGRSSGGLYVWGFDRGQGAPLFANDGIEQVFFDSVLVATSTGEGTINYLSEGGSAILPSGSVKISGSDISVKVQGSLLPSLGKAQEDYTWNLWPRDGKVQPLAFDGISDFAPDNSNAGLTSTPVPEPSSILGTLAFGALGGVLMLKKQRKKQKLASRNTDCT